jgi:tetratricopeptide (TPR) repeat protein
VWAAALAVALAATAAYRNSFRVPFLFDDPPSIVQNLTVKSLRPIWEVLSPPGGGFTVSGRPVINLSIAVNRALHDERVWGYHAFNLGVHILAALTLLGIVRRTLLLPALAGRFARHAPALALAVALIWAVHPLQTNAVTYIVQRAESIMGLLLLLTLYCVIRGATSRRPAAWYGAAVVACGLGMASKEVMVAAPLVVAVYDRTFLAGSFGRALRRRWVVYLLLAGTWGILAALVTGRGATAGFGYGIGPWDYARTQFGVILHYLRLSLWPVGLCLDYGWPIADSPGEILPGAIVIGLVLAATAWALWRKPAWGFLGAWFFLILAPTSSVVPIRDAAFEHRMYLPLAAIVAAGVFAVYLGWRRLVAALRKHETVGELALWAAPGLLIGVVATLGYRTVMRNRDFASEVAIWEDTIRKAPRNARAHHNLGLALRKAGDPAAAVKQYSEALRLNAEGADAYNNRGVALGQLGRFDEAVRDYSRAIDLGLRDAPIYSNRGNAYEHLRLYRKAVQDHTEAIRLNPSYYPAYCNRGNAWAAQKRYRIAIKDYDEALRRCPGYAVAYLNRGIARYHLGEYRKAIEDYTRAIECDPDSAAAYVNRALAHKELHEYEPAIADCGRAIGRDRRCTEAYLYRAICFYHTRQFGRAWADVRVLEGLNFRLDPQFLRDLAEASPRPQ